MKTPSWPRALAALAAALALACATSAQAAPYIWDEDEDKIDDRVETVHLFGYEFSFQANDSLALQRIDVTRVPNDLLFGVYVVFDHTPDDTDFLALAAIGMPVLHRYDAVPGVRSAATFAQIEAVTALPGVERVEAIPVLHPALHEGVGAIGMRDASLRTFPTWEGTGGGNGAGIVIAFLDSGINDEQDGSYPGHEAVLGRCLGGAVHLYGDSALDTPPQGSVNPTDRGGPVTNSHGTHVAAIALGSGGASGYAAGVAPGARFLDLKVLNDAGVGTGLAEALDWCIANRDRSWGPAGYEGIDVINLSTSSVDRSDGNDLAARLANRAVELGIVVVASMGNGGQAAHVPSPAGADRVIAVGAFDHQHTSVAGDDRFADFGNTGPRASDGDLDAHDEQKPDVLAPGVAILSADGSLSSDGAQYQRISGTSMSAAFVSGAVAALLSSYPSLEPAAVAELLRATAKRELQAVPPGQGGADPRWSSSIGYGAIDLHAALLELQQSGRSQVVGLELSGSESMVEATVHTQREFGPVMFHLERAPDQGGAPGTFQSFDSFLGTGDASLMDADNRQSYVRIWTLPEEQLGATAWYRVAYEQGGTPYVTPARRFVHPTGPPVATLEITVVHNAFDSDVAAVVRAGGGFALPLSGTSAAVSSDWVNGVSTLGNVAWTWRIDVPAGAASAFLPPTPYARWRLEATEGGFLNRSGRITRFDVIWHGPVGDETYAGSPLPLQTVEGQTSVVSAPPGVLDVDDPLVPRFLELMPNPIVAGGAVTFQAPLGLDREVRIFDLAGREISRVPLAPAGTSARARWEARDRDGAPLAPGVYFAAIGNAPRKRVVVLR